MVKKTTKTAADGAEPKVGDVVEEHTDTGATLVEIEITAPNHFHNRIAIPIGGKIKVTEGAAERLIAKKRAKAV